ncbi:hypothetical protein [Streptomyces sp. NPDC059168]|uniref:hypothetical protein n=1 Tax=Streptomyces sp. NPDC059168 TaxID=3346753 RepID=UPI00367E939A
MESAQIGPAGRLFRKARRALDGRQWTRGELRLLAIHLPEAPAHVHRIAVSRGERLPSPAYADLDTLGDEDDEDDELDASRMPRRA